MMSLLVSLCMQWAIKAKSRWMAVLFWLVAGFGAASVLLLTEGRTGYLGLLLSMSVFSLTLWWRRPKTLVAVISLGAVALLTAYQLSPQFQQRTNLALEQAQNHSASSVTSVGARIEVWRFMAQHTHNATLLGAGTASYPVIARSYFKDPEFCVSTESQFFILPGKNRAAAGHRSSASGACVALQQIGPARFVPVEG